MDEGTQIADEVARMTATRHAAMARFLSLGNCDHAFMWLIDRVESQAEALLGYHLGPEITLPRNKRITIRLPFDTNSAADLDLNLRLFLDEFGFDDRRFLIYPFGRHVISNTITLEEFSQPPIPLGYIQYGPTNTDNISEHTTREIELLALCIESGRLRRIVEALSAVHTTVEEQTSRVDDLLRAVGDVMSKHLGAERFVYKNSNTTRKWQRIDEGKVTDIALQYRGVDNPTVLNFIERRAGKFQISDNSDFRNIEVLIVPIQQSSYKLKKLSFSDISTFESLLSKHKSNDITLLFLQKIFPDYLQDKFTQTDLSIAKTVFGYLDPYVSTRIFGDNYNSVIAFLNEHASKSTSNSELILQIVQRLSVKFTNIYLLNAKYIGDEYVLECERATKESDLSDDYKHRLRADYLMRNFGRAKKRTQEQLFVGLDPIESGYLIEFHFTSEAGMSKFMILEYNGDVIIESILISLIHLFREVHVRLQMEDHQNDRASYLTQVRHAVIHHFAAATRSMKSLQSVWDRGIKSENYWKNLYFDPIVPGTLNRAIWSLGQAQLIMENGRFLIDELQPNSLNRKPFRLVKLIQDCLSTLKDIREERNIAVIQKIEGIPPTVMNADETVLKIAILNLFDNALKYSPVSKKIKWTVQFGFKSYRFELTSAGQPLDERQREWLFQVGYRGYQKDRLNLRHGTGLGLPIAYKILKAHSPTSELLYRPEHDLADLDSDTGNTFYFEMPYLTGQTNFELRT
jgi:signal transduction histidine kinase